MGRLRMVRRLEAGARLCDVAAALDLSTTSVRRWWRRYQAEGIAGLSDRSSRPHHSPRALPRVQRRQIARRRQWGWSSLRIARDLRLALPTVVHVQRRLGLARRPRPLHMAIDDRTRLAYAALFPDETAASAAAFLALAHRWFAARGVVIRGLLTDNGSAYRGHRFGALCGRLELRHSWTRPYRPQTNGKAERFIRSCLGEWAYARSYPTSVARASALPDFLRYYNEDRFHMGINGLTPMQRLATHSEQRLH